MILHSIESVFSIVFMIGLGIFLTHKGWFDEKVSRVFAKMVTQVSLPAYMVWNLTSVFDKEKLIGMKDGLIVPFLSMVAAYLAAYVVSKFLKIDNKRQGTFRTMFFVSNTIFIGLPINMALFGHESVPYVLLYYIANTFLFWTLGVYSISGDGEVRRPKLFSFGMLSKLVNMPLGGFAIGVILVLTEIKLPPFVTDTCLYLGSMTTPLSMLFIGISMYGAGLKNIKITKDMLALVMGRFIISPALVALLCVLFPLPTMMKQVFIIQAAMPIITQSSIVCKAYRADHQYAALMILVTTVLSIVMIPIYMALMQHNML
jgi:predicted permease